MVKLLFDDGSLLEEPDALNFGYNIGKYGDMTVVLVGDDDTTMISVHNKVRSAWKVAPIPVAQPTPAIDISSMPKKAK